MFNIFIKANFIKLKNIYIFLVCRQLITTKMYVLYNAFT